MIYSEYSFKADAGSYFCYKHKGICKVQNRVSGKLPGERRVLFARHSREESENEVECIQKIFNDDLEEIATWRQNDLLAIQNGDSRLFGAKIDLETCNAANTIEETMYIGGGYGKKRQ